MKKVTIKTSTIVRIVKDIDGANVVQRAVVQVKGTGWTGHFIPKQLIAGASKYLTSADAKQIPYFKRDASVLTEIAAGTAISADGIYEFDINGVELYADHTQVAGQVDLYVNALDG